MTVRIKKPPEKATAQPPARVGPATQIPLIYADGVGNVLLSPLNTKITLVLNTGVGTIPVMEIVIPTPALLGFIAQMQHHLKEQGPSMLKVLDEAKKQLSQQIEQPDK